MVAGKEGCYGEGAAFSCLNQRIMIHAEVRMSRVTPSPSNFEFSVWFFFLRNLRASLSNQRAQFDLDEVCLSVGGGLNKYIILKILQIK